MTKMTKRFFEGVPNSGAKSGVSGRTRSRTALTVAHGAPGRMRMGSAIGGVAQLFLNRVSAVPQPCFGRFSPAVFVGVPIGVSLPQIALIGRPWSECGLG